MFTLETWLESVTAGLNVMGFRAIQESLVRRIRPEDVLICYLRGHMRFVAALRVDGPVSVATLPVIWKSDPFPVRLPVQHLVVLTPETAVHARAVLPQLSFATVEGKVIANWGSRLQGSPRPLPPEDGVTLLAALREAAAHPTSVPLGKVANKI